MKRFLILFACLWPLFSFGQDALSVLARMYSVSKGETWESIAADHNVTVAELMAANPNVSGRKLKKGTLLLVPDSRPAAAAVVAEPGPQPAEPATMPRLKVGVMLHFGDPAMVEFYRGLLMAADQVRHGAIDLEIHAWNCGTAVAQIQQLVPMLEGFDVIFGPTSATQVPALAEVCQEKGIRLVLPFSTAQVQQDYPLTYSVAAPGKVLYSEATGIMARNYTNKNYVFVDTGQADHRGSLLIETLALGLSQLITRPRNLVLSGDEFAYESAFNQFRDNWVVLDNSSVATLRTVLEKLKAFRQKHPVYRISLVGFPEWMAEAETLRKDLCSFDTYIPSPCYYNPGEAQTRQFEQRYKGFFHESPRPGTPSAAAYGYDLGMYFLGGLTKLGNAFEQQQGSLPQQPLQHRFLFERSVAGMSFCNHFLQLIHFTPDEKIELIR